ncbi:hypothetical protein ACHAWF_015598 [Thalassiosira exigua]
MERAAVLPHRRPRGGLKRKRSDGGADAEDLRDFKRSSHSLRLPASSVSALCGLHPFQVLPRLLFDFVYQSRAGQLLLQRDAEALGLTLVDANEHERETMLNLASAASRETEELVKQVLEVSEGKRKLQSTEEVQAIQGKIRAQASEARESGRLTAKQVESLVEASRGHVSTGFGTCHEEEALDAYEKRTGCRVRERNEALMEWNFQRVCDCDSELGVTAVPLGRAKRREWKPPDGREARDEEEKTSRASHDGSCSKPSEPEIVRGGDATQDRSAPTATVNKPFFRIVGAVDGMTDELRLESPNIEALHAAAPTHSTNGTSSVSADSGVIFNDVCHDSPAKDEYFNEDDQWTLRSIIVECKHRMNEAKVPPPLYDQIQTCLYCQMYNVEDADLIQVVRRKGTVRSDDKEDIEKRRENMKMTISRVSLNDPIHNHSYHWNATLLPRLASFVDAVYSVRGDDGKRYRLLMTLSSQDEGGAEEVESWKVLWDECPWLVHCDTSFGKRRS